LLLLFKLRYTYIFLYSRKCLSFAEIISNPFTVFVILTWTFCLDMQCQICNFSRHLHDHKFGIISTSFSELIYAIASFLFFSIDFIWYLVYVVQYRQRTERERECVCVQDFTVILLCFTVFITLIVIYLKQLSFTILYLKEYLT